MKTFFIAGSCVFLILFGLAQGAGAAMVTARWTDDNWAPAQNAVDSRHGLGLSANTYRHNIFDDGFAPRREIINTYTIAISLTDDSPRHGWSPEWARIDLPGFRGDSLVNASAAENIFGGCRCGLISINEGDVLNVSIYPLWGDFRLTGSQLISDNQKIDAAATPIPASVLLLGCGLFALAAFRRRSNRAALSMSCPAV